MKLEQQLTNEQFFKKFNHFLMKNWTKTKQVTQVPYLSQNYKNLGDELSISTDTPCFKPFTS